MLHRNTERTLRIYVHRYITLSVEQFLAITNLKPRRLWPIVNEADRSWGIAPSTICFSKLIFKNTKYLTNFLAPVIALLVICGVFYIDRCLLFTASLWNGCVSDTHRSSAPRSPMILSTNYVVIACAVVVTYVYLYLATRNFASRYQASSVIIKEDRLKPAILAYSQLNHIAVFTRWSGCEKVWHLFSVNSLMKYTLSTETEATILARYSILVCHRDRVTSRWLDNSEIKCFVTSGVLELHAIFNLKQQEKNSDTWEDSLAGGNERLFRCFQQVSQLLCHYCRNDIVNLYKIAKSLETTSIRIPSNVNLTAISQSMAAVSYKAQRTVTRSDK